MTHILLNECHTAPMTMTLPGVWGTYSVDVALLLLLLLLLMLLLHVGCCCWALLLLLVVLQLLLPLSEASTATVKVTF